MSPARLNSFDPGSAAAYRRGRLLTLVLVLVTGAGLLWSPFLHACFGFPPGQPPARGLHPWLDFLWGGGLVVALCWFAWRGGAISTGCMSIPYSLFFAVFAFSSLADLATFTWRLKKGLPSQLSGISTRVFGQTFDGTLSMALLGAWIVFGFWVLVVSQDARLYRHARRIGLDGLDKSFDQWEHRRP